MGRTRWGGMEKVSLSREMARKEKEEWDKLRALSHSPRLFWTAYAKYLESRRVVSNGRKLLHEMAVKELGGE